MLPALLFGPRGGTFMSLASMPRSLSLLVFVTLATASMTGCKIFKTNCEEDDRDCLGGGYQRSGGECTRNGDCAVGLECIEGVCEYAGSTKRGKECVATAECGPNLYCSHMLTCQPISENAQPEGGACGSTADCKKGLVCDIDVTTLFTDGPFGELSDECQMISASGDLPEECALPKKCVSRGDKDAGDKCKSSDECLAGLICEEVPGMPELGRICFAAPLPQEPVSLPTWDGDECPADDVGQPTAYFEVPRASGDNKDFYRLPFPNDIRVKNGRVDLSGHPQPPAETDLPAVERFISAAGTLGGFATNPVVYFRFSEPYETNGDVIATSVRIVDITPDSPDYNKASNIDWSPSGLSSNYICPNWFALRRPVGTPLRPGNTYAAILTRTIKTDTGQAFARSADLDAMLSSIRPSDEDLGAAHDKYKPLRDWIIDSNTDPDSLLNVAVFTTQKATAITEAMHEAVQNLGAPSVSELTVCDTAVKSPCEDEVTKRGACHAADPDYTEIHGRISLPIFQQGTPPYEIPEQGGAIALDANGKAVKQMDMSVCFALTVPTKSAPAKGYPVVIYGHGTGGSFAGQTGPGGLADDLSQSATPTALLAIDMPEHGNRRGDSLRPPEDLFFNFANPEGARGNVLQGAADLMSLVQLVQQGSISKGDSPTGAEIPFDPTRVTIYGHSQGATHTAVMLPFEAGANAGVLSGVGGHLATSLLNKKKPVDISKILPFVLFDANNKGELVGGLFNPMLAIVQMFYEAADPINYGRLVHVEPSALAPTGHHVFMTFGLTDNFSPDATQAAYATSAKLTAVLPLLTDLALSTQAAPVSENELVGSALRTVGVRQYDPAVNPIGGTPTDGHFVASATQGGREDVLRFLQHVADGVAPQIGAP
jgi:hypothetical protein